MIKSDVVRLWVTLSLSFLLTGCGATSPAVSYYSLSALADPGDRVTSSRSVPAIGVGPVVLPDYLDRPQLVTRTGLNQVRLDEYHRWAGAPAQEVVRTVTENLIVLLGSDRIAPIPWPVDFSPDLTVRLEIYALEGIADGSARLRATITLVDERPGAMTTTWTADLREPAASRAHEALVATQSRLLAQLSRQIAEAIIRPRQE